MICYLIFDDKEVKMLSKTLEKALNDQLQKEMNSFYLYLAMAAYFEGEKLQGFAHWMKEQAKEELAHAMKFYSHIFEMGGQVALEGIEKPKSHWTSPLEAFEEAYEHEKSITQSINEVMDQAIKDKNYPVQVFLNWFVKEQVEEENAAEEIVHKLSLIGDAPQGLYLLNRELGQRGRS